MLTNSRNIILLFLQTNLSYFFVLCTFNFKIAASLKVAVAMSSSFRAGRNILVIE